MLTGFVNTDDEAHGRPVGVAIDRTGALLVADDVGNVIWRVSPQGLSSRLREARDEFMRSHSTRRRSAP